MDKQTGQTAQADPMDQFINQILDEKQLPGETPEVRQQLVADLRTRLMSQIDRAMLGALSSQQLDQLNQMLDRQDLSDSDIQNFFRNSGVDGQQVALDTMLRFRNYYLGTETTTA